MSHVLIYIPSYFDYVRLRNYFRREGLNFVQICEYSKVSDNIKIMVFWGVILGRKQVPLNQCMFLTHHVVSHPRNE